MPILYLLRHAKSSWDDAAIPDHDRPLSARGRRACERLRRHCRQHAIEPELVLCSTATRTRETLAAVLPDAVDARFESSLYHATAPRILERIRGLTVESAMIVGHNPGLQEALIALAAPSALREAATEKLPTGALATLELRAWGAASGDLVAFVVPRDL